MNLFELLFLALAVFLSILMGKYFFAMGWWGMILGGILGFGIVAAILAISRKLLGHRDKATPRKRDS
jgi:hypothetical protein